MQVLETLVGGIMDFLGVFGIYQPYERALLVLVLSLGYLFTVRPARSFDDQGNPLPWAYNHDGPGVSTWLPWWLESLVLSLLTFLFI